MAEVWRIVPSVPAFMVSSEGRIMVRPYVSPMPNGGTRQYGGNPHWGVWDKIEGRFVTVLKKRTYRVARLVCEAFHGPAPQDMPVCMHLDENAANNSPDNLAWGTQKENLNAPAFREYQRSGDLRASVESRAARITSSGSA